MRFRAPLTERRTGRLLGSTPLHEDAKLLLRGIPPAQLTVRGLFDELVCPNCSDLLLKRRELSDRHL